MKANHLFSFGFDPALLIRDYEQVTTSEVKHHNVAFYDGEWKGLAIRKPTNVFVELDSGSMESSEFEDTPASLKTPYIQQVLAFFQCEKTSVRLMNLTAGSLIKPHSDERLGYFDGFVRLHVPIITNDHVEFIADGESLKMLPGQCWFADFSKTHSVANRGTEDRIHLIIDLKVNEWLTELFVKEGILAEAEEAPDPMDAMSEESKLATVRALLEQGTQASKSLAQGIIDRYQLDITL